VARHVKDVTVADGEEFAPGTSFVKTWRVRNEGREWPAGSMLMFVSRCRGDQMSGPDFVPVEGGSAVANGQEVELSVPLVAPLAAGRYTGFWRMVTADGKKFGQRLWVSITVASSSSSSEPEPAPAVFVDEEKVRVVEEMGFGVKRSRIERMLKNNGGDVNLVVQKLVKKSFKHQKHQMHNPNHHQLKM